MQAHHAAGARFKRVEPSRGSTCILSFCVNLNNFLNSSGNLILSDELQLFFFFHSAFGRPDLLQDATDIEVNSALLFMSISLQTRVPAPPQRTCVAEM